MKFIQLLLTQASAYLLAPGIDYYGGDLFPIRDVNSTDKCLRLCEKITGCKLATWCDETCYIKNYKTEPSYKLNCTTIDMFPESNFTKLPETDTITFPASTSPVPEKTKTISMAEKATLTPLMILCMLWTSFQN
jgi:hypothetical protein